jgi:hypothetical protein
VALNGPVTTQNGGGVTVKALGDVTTQQPVITENLSVTTNSNIEIYSHSGDLNINGNLTAKGGGVKLVANAGKIYTTGGTDDTLNIAITGQSDQSQEIGVGLPLDPSMKSAIVIISEEDLRLGSGTTLTASGLYDPQVDDRDGVYFVPDGDPIDTAIYLGCTGTTYATQGNVYIDSQTTIAPKGAMVVVASDIVEDYGSEFVLSLSNNTLDRLEVGSLRAVDLQTAINLELLPHADEPDDIANGAFIQGGGTYVLRGLAGTLGLAVLDLTAPVPLVLPMPLEPEIQGEVERPDTEAIMQFLEELGLEADMPLLAAAYQESLNTDLRLYKAVEKLMRLEEILNDSTRIAVLVPLIQGITETPVTTEEQMASFVQELNRQESAGQWINALTEFVAILNIEIGQELEASMVNAMRLYGNKLGGEDNEIFVEEYLAQRFFE